MGSEQGKKKEDFFSLFPVGPLPYMVHLGIVRKSARWEERKEGGEDLGVWAGSGPEAPVSFTKTGWE